jgi:CBS domain-containing protein
VRTRDIVLLPIGGIARLERIPENPWQEFWIALAGPAVNGVLALTLYVLIVLGRGMAASEEVWQIGGNILDQLLWVNVMLALFNLLPAFPMDGGRVLRALLAMRIDYVKATEAAAEVGQALALLLGFLGLLGNPLLVFIALFVWLGAGHEASLVTARSLLAHQPLQRVMISEFKTLRPDDSLSQAVEHVLAGFQHDFPVVEDGALVGMLGLKELLEGLTTAGATGAVRHAMNREFESVHPGEALEGTLARLQDSTGRSWPVVRDGRLIGIFTLDNVNELLSIENALRFRPRPPRAAPSVTGGIPGPSSSSFVSNA